jgi:hypothetical protein
VADMRINGSGAGPQPLRPNARSEAVLKAQKAFFDAARTSPAVQTSTQVQTSAQLRPSEPVRSIAPAVATNSTVAPDTSGSRTGQRLLRPGSILDIRV